MSDLERESLPSLPPHLPPLGQAFGRSMLAPSASAPLPPLPDVLAEGTLPSADPVPRRRSTRERTRDRDATLIVRPLQDELDRERRPRWWIAPLAAVVALTAVVVLVLQAVRESSRPTPQRDLAAVADAIKPSLDSNAADRQIDPKAVRATTAKHETKADKAPRVAKAAKAPTSTTEPPRKTVDAASTRKATPATESTAKPRPAIKPAKVTRDMRANTKPATKATPKAAKPTPAAKTTTKVAKTTPAASPNAKPAKPAMKTAKASGGANAAKIARDAKPANTTPATKATKATRNAPPKRATTKPARDAAKPATETKGSKRGAKTGAARTPRTAR